MNEYLLNIVGFTPRQWEEFKVDVRRKVRLYWKKGINILSSKQALLVGSSLIILGLLYWGVSRSIAYLSRPPQRASRPEVPQSTMSAEQKRKLEVDLETLRNRTLEVLDADPDLLYPSLETEIEFEQ